MKLLPSKREKILTVADRWLEAYPTTKQNIHQQLQDLNKETCSAKDVALITGNSFWTYKPKCNECGKETYKLVQLGETPNYESNTAYICKACLVKALDLFQTTNGE